MHTTCYVCGMIYIYIQITYQRSQAGVQPYDLMKVKTEPPDGDTNDTTPVASHSFDEPVNDVSAMQGHTPVTANQEQVLGNPTGAGDTYVLQHAVPTNENSCMLAETQVSDTANQLLQPKATADYPNLTDTHLSPAATAHNSAHAAGTNVQTPGIGACENFGTMSMPMMQTNNHGSTSEQPTHPVPGNGSETWMQAAEAVSPPATTQSRSAAGMKAVSKMDLRNKARLDRVFAVKSDGTYKVPDEAVKDWKLGGAGKERLVSIFVDSGHNPDCQML
jgi:hypothetical protein